jgi:flagellin-like hook-associated protein FlgL
MHKRILYILPLFSLLMFATNISKGQQMTTIKGLITDSLTGEPLPFVNIIFMGKHIGTTTDFDGKYNLSTQWASQQVQVSFLGYKTYVKTIKTGQSQTINIKLSPSNIQLNAVTIKGEKKRYRNKNNPAVDLIKNVVDKKDFNRQKSLKYYQYDKYEKVEMSLNNFTERFQNKKGLRKFQFIFNYVDTSKVNGKPYLPVYLKETSSRVYYRNSPETMREYIDGDRTVGLEGYLDQDGITSINKSLYTDIDIYNNDIFFMTNQFVSPVSVIAPTFYKFFIVDTSFVDGIKCYNLAFLTRNPQDFGFTGNIWITADTNYAVKKVELGVGKDHSLNFVSDVKIVLDYEQTKSGAWVKANDETTVDYSFSEKRVGMFAHRTVAYRNRVFNQQMPDSTYGGVQTAIYMDGSRKRAKDWWSENRLIPLSRSEAGVEEMMTKVQNVPAFKRFMDILMLLFAGYKDFGPIDVGPINTFYSFNSVEGLRLRVGGKTNVKFSDRLMLEGFYAYGTKDERHKYLGAVTYSFRKIDNQFLEFPVQALKVTYQHDTKIPGQDLKFFAEDNFLLSFKRGISDKMTYNDLFKLEFIKELNKGFSYTLTYKYLEQSAAGNWRWDYSDKDPIQKTADGITTSEFGINFRYAPNEQFYQGKTYRIPIFNKYPVFQLKVNAGAKNLLNGQYDYQTVTTNFFKRFYMSVAGYGDMEFEAGKIWGKVPLPLLFIHNANQTYAYQLQAYNMMNFLEFATDQYISLNYTHYFNGLIFNRIPLFKKLKFREVMSFKGLYGTISDRNMPTKNGGLFLFPTASDGTSLTYTPDREPYIEASVGIANILKFLRVDLVKRITYLDHPNVPEYGIRARFKFDF